VINVSRLQSRSKAYTLVIVLGLKNLFKHFIKKLGKAIGTTLVAVCGLYLIEPILQSVSHRYKIFVTYTVRRHDAGENKRYKFGIPSILAPQVYPRVTKSQMIFQDQLMALSNPFNNRIAIVIQGPINHSESFTFNTVKHYFANFSNIQIILSTWNDEDLSQFRIFQENPSFHIVRSVKPEFSGMFNINLQIISTLEGVKKARNLGCDYVIKTRTDQAFLNHKTLNHLWLLRNNYCQGNAESRIVALSRNTFLYRLYGISDMFLFGRIEDLELFWGVALDTRGNPAFSEKNLMHARSDLTLKDYSISELCEVYLVANYIRVKGIKLDFSLKQSLEVYRDLFVIMDSQSLDLIWDKYTRNEDRWRRDVQPSPFYEVTFLDWLAFQADLDSYLKFSSVVELPMEYFK
jgi:hypothetical protein